MATGTIRFFWARHVDLTPAVDAMPTVMCLRTLVKTKVVQVQ